MDRISLGSIDVKRTPDGRLDKPTMDAIRKKFEDSRDDAIGSLMAQVQRCSVRTMVGDKVVLTSSLILEVSIVEGP